VQQGLAAGESTGAVRGFASSEKSSAAREEAKSTRAGREQPARRKRKFPYRKVPELEAEILQRETRIEELHEQLATPEVLRDGDRVKSIKAEIDDQKAALVQLYEHWEEALELN
jgi:ATP-binding cassette subfamily F protein 3